MFESIMLKTNQVPFQKGYDENIAKYKYISKIIKKGHTEGNLGFIWIFVGLCRAS